MPVPAGYAMLESGFWYKTSDQSGPYTYDGSTMAMVGGASKQRPLSNILGRQLCQRQLQAGPAASAYTFRQAIAIEAPGATRFRIALHNSQAQPMTITEGMISVSNRYGSTLAERYTPSTGLWLALKWGGSSTVTVAAGTATRPTIVWSDWIDISTIPRADGGTLPIFLVSMVVPNGGYYCTGAEDLTNWNSQAATDFPRGRFWSTFRYTGASGIANPNDFAAAGTFPYPFVLGYEYACRRSGITFMIPGDSIGEGSVDTANFGNGWAWQAINLLRQQFPDIPIELMVTAISSTPTGTFVARIQDVISAGSHFDVMFYSAHSPNDGTPSQANIDAENSRLAQVSEMILAANKQLILSTPCPNDFYNWTAAEDAFRTTLKANILASVGVLKFDLDGAVSTLASPGRFKPGKTILGTHPNESACADIAAVAVVPMRQCVPI